MVRTLAAMLLAVAAFTAHPLTAQATTTPSVSVGGVFYIDRDRDGEFGPGDAGVSIVEVVLTGPDGASVVDVNGDPVGNATTDNGLYRFDLLPVLELGESYTVTVPPIELSGSTVLELVSAGGVPVPDPTTAVAVSGDVSTPGASDLTLDFVQVYQTAFVTIDSFTTAEGPDDGDHDFPSNAQIVEPDTPVDVSYRVTNGGNEPLTDLSVTFESAGDPPMGPLDCDFSEFGGLLTGTTWDGPLPVGASFTCQSMFPGLPADSEHQSSVSVDATGETTGTAALNDVETWTARADPATTSTTAAPSTTTPVATTTTPPGQPAGQLPETGTGHASTAWAAALLSTIGGLLVLIARRRNFA